MAANAESPALSRAELALLDRLAAEEYGLPTAVLMENAGRGAAEVVLAMLAETRSRTGEARVVLLAGPGNNGGDACVAARHLANARARFEFEFEVEVVATRASGALRGDAATMRRAIERMGIPIHESEGSLAAIDRASLIVDGLCGTGFQAPMGPEIARLVRSANARRSSGLARTVALDLPSGLDADSGGACDPTIQADVTVTFAARKLGFSARSAAPFLGRVGLVSIGAPAEILEKILAARSRAAADR